MVKKAQTEILNYRVVIEREHYGDGSSVYVTHVPTLGISDYGSTLEEALENTGKMIKFHVECLIDEEEAVPTPDDPNNIFVAVSEVKIRPRKKFAFG